MLTLRKIIQPAKNYAKVPIAIINGNYSTN